MAFHVFKNVDQGNSFIVTVIAIPVCVLITILRMTLPGKKIAWDDFFAFLALLAFLTYCGCNLWILCAMNGKNVFHLGALSKKTVVEIYKAGYVMNIMTPLNQTFAKLSLLILYHRLFRVERTFRYEVYIVGSAQTAWCIANVLIRLFFCKPIRATWDPLIKGKCLDPNKLLAVGGAVNGFIDFVMIAMALQIVQKLQLPRKEKIKMGFLFAIGGFSGCIEIIKISIVYGSVGNSNIGATWNVAEMATTLICCCFPIYKPFFRQSHKLLQKARARLYSSNLPLFSTRKSTTKGSTIGAKNSRDEGDEWLRLDEHRYSPQEMGTKSGKDSFTSSKQMQSM